ncbi:MAG: sulfotransferase family protein [Solirubrobacterales bacterium]
MSAQQVQRRRAGPDRPDQLSPERRARLPNLIVIGAAKAGTTSLHTYLDAHPEIGMSRIKELNFFDRSDCFDRLDWYLDQFDPDCKIRGESSPNYTKSPRFTGQPERIHSLIPSARLIYLVRDPVDRSIAHWAHNVAAGEESRPFEEALVDPDPGNTYLCASRYATQLNRYLEHFSQDQILVLDQHRLLHRRDDAINQVFRFLDVRDDFSSPEFDRELNSRRDQRRLTGPGRSLLRSAPASALRLLPPRVRQPLRFAARRGLSRRVRRPPVTPAVRARLEVVFEPEANRLREITGQRFESWSV